MGGEGDGEGCGETHAESSLEVGGIQFDCRQVGEVGRLDDAKQASEAEQARGDEEAGHEMPEFVLPFSFGLTLSSLTLRVTFQFANESNLKAGDAEQRGDGRDGECLAHPNQVPIHTAAAGGVAIPADR